MEYFVKRQDQEFGPYTLADLQEYVGSGHILDDDLTKSEGMTDWIPVSQVLGNIPIPDAVPVAVERRGEQRELVPLPPNLHWGILLVLEILSRQLFNFVWVLVLANWARKLSRDNKPLVQVAMYPAGFLVGIVASAYGFEGPLTEAISRICMFAGFVMYLVGIFSIRRAMEDYYNSTENIRLSLHGGMTLFFSAVYLQYHVNRIARWKKTGVLS